jgi:hypothetical protein
MKALEFRMLVHKTMPYFTVQGTMETQVFHFLFLIWDIILKQWYQMMLHI